MIFGILAAVINKTMDKWVHIIGICGVTTSGIAVCFKNMGWKVTGSDKGFFPPVTDYLEHYGIKIMPGFKKERLTEEGKHPDLIVFQGTKGRFNEEILEAKELHIEIKSYPEILKEYLIVKDNSIVITGSFGKTTTTAILSKIFEYNNSKVNYMYGGLNPNFDPNIKITEGAEVSIVEGDEYITSFEDMKSKFFHYQPKNVLLTGVTWDHADVFKSEKDYIDNFIKFIKLIPEDGLLVVNSNDKNSVDISKNAKCKVIYYSNKLQESLVPADWYLLTESKPLPCIVSTVKPGDDLEIIPFERNIIGKINEQNILAAIAFSRELNIKKDVIQRAVKDFNGIKRRMEMRYKDENVSIIDDFGSTPGKVRLALRLIDEDFPNTKKIVVFEPSAGSRAKKSLDTYKGSFDNADFVLLPRFTILPPNKKIERFAEHELIAKLTSQKIDAQVFFDDEKLVQEVLNIVNKNKKCVVLFMGSHSFRKVIPNLIKSIGKN